MSLSSINHQGFSKQVMEEAYSYDQGYTTWNPPPYQHHTPQYDAYQSNGYGDAYYGYEDPPPPYPPSQNGIEEALQLLCKERKELLEAQSESTMKDLPSQPLSNPRRCIGTLFLCTNQEGREDALLHEEDVENLNHEEVHDSEDLPSQPLSNPRGCIGTLFLCTNQEGKEDALLHEEDVESLNQEEVHECLEEVEEENEDQEAEDVDQEENLSNLTFIGQQHYGLLETDGQLRALCGVLDKKEVNIRWLNDSRCIMGGVLKLEAQNGERPHKFPCYVIDAKRWNLRKHLESWPFQEKRNDQQGLGWTNRVWDPGRSFMNRHFWGVIACIGAFRGLLNINWDPLGHTKFKHRWGFKDEFKHKPP
ncbi:hypothetical protein PIB30_049551 [Stylosanthes scabra]|uniref:Uncharacterized protein n=1 Tax=Stylosanthes scabra TaxID=79078 RepID=A0ABU6ZG36_9FABA|nr:hypothetical protein [Stylosanthes scabra]